MTCSTMTACSASVPALGCKVGQMVSAPGIAEACAIRLLQQREVTELVSKEAGNLLTLPCRTGHDS